MKILYITTISNTVNAFLIPHIRMLINEGHQVDVAFNIEQEVESEVTNMGCKVYALKFKRSPLSVDNYKAYKKLKKIIQLEKYELVHTHTPVASLCTRLACKGINDVKVFYTAHGFHFFKGAPIANWLLYYCVERWLARYTDVLITINNEDYERAKNSFKAGRVEYIPGVGIDINDITKLESEETTKLKELDTLQNVFILLSVGELNKNKNHETVIKALSKLNNSQIHYLICGQGPSETHLRNLIKELNLEKQVHLLGYRSDIAKICKASDIFIFPSFREGLSVSLMEAMATGLPVVCSNIRGNTDLIIDKKGGYLVRPDDVDGFANAISALIVDGEIRKAMTTFNLETVKKFELKNVTKELNRVYKG